MKLIREGKTKTVFETEDGNFLLRFKDDVTGSGDVVDPGANEVIGKIEGKGNASLKLSKYFFAILKSRGIRTHYIEADLEANTMLVKRAETFGDGLRHAVHLEAAQHDDDGTAGGIMTHGGSPRAAHHSVRHWQAVR